MTTISRRTPLQRWRSAWRRWSLWAALVLLVVSMLATLVWLAGLYEASQVQSRVERDAADAVSDIRAALTRNLQTLQALQAERPAHPAWETGASGVLRQNRELVRIELRDTRLRVLAQAQSPYRPLAWELHPREGGESNAAIACTIVALAQSLGLDVVAEGVETQGQREFLLRNGCQQFQGYLFGRPGPADLI